MSKVHRPSIVGLFYLKLSSVPGKLFLSNGGPLVPCPIDAKPLPAGSFVAALWPTLNLIYGGKSGLKPKNLIKLENGFRPNWIVVIRCRPRAWMRLSPELLAVVTLLWWRGRAEDERLGELARVRFLQSRAF